MMVGFVLKQIQSSRKNLVTPKVSRKFLRFPPFVPCALSKQNCCVEDARLSIIAERFVRNNTGVSVTIKPVARTRSDTPSIRLSISSVVCRTIISKDMEFLIIKPTEKLASIADICETALEDCDDVCDIEGFGTNQIDALWVPTQRNHPVDEQVRKRFGWTSVAYGVERMEGYRPVEDMCVYIVLFDDCFQDPAMSPGLETSYCGAGCFALPEGKQCRGNVVIFRLMITKKAWKSQKIPSEAS